MPRPSRAIARIVSLGLVLGGVSTLSALPAEAARVKTISINDVSIVEGTGGAKSLAFTVSWKGSKGGPAPSVNYATANATATAGSDYTSKTGTANLTNGGCRCATVAISITGDNVHEGTETFVVDLSNAQNGVIGDAQGVGTIYDNEGPPALIVTDATADEGAGTMGFSVVLTSASSSDVTVDYATTAGTAAAGTDYTTTAGTLTFTAGQTSTTVAVPITQDSLSEDTETFTLELSNASGAGVTASQGVGSIADDDADPTVSIGDVTVGEGASGTTSAWFSVSLSATAGREVAVDYATGDATATSGSDYAEAIGSLTFAAGETTKDVVVDVTGDAVYEGDETFGVSLSSPVNADLGDAAGIGTIADDDPTPSVSIDDVAVTEGTGSATTATFTVSLSNPSAFAASVDWATADGTALAGSDYAAGSGTLSFTAGELTKPVEVVVEGDAVDEVAETFTIVLSGAGGATIADDTGLGTVTDDDKTATGLTAKVRKGATTVRVSGLLETAAAGMKISVTLQRKKGARYVKVASTAATVKKLLDRDGDGLTDGAYAASFRKSRKAAYRFVLKYAGSPEFLPCGKKVAFRL